ncbi:peptidoglycan-binding protein [Martelella lutilitoris]|uniref:Peptidoglycan-binding protein n=1 Tax=Martelella lutilitoris TaxID=2583532 RepID=A0A5C4JN71_9HYPH|nr:peptidoglycan-binding protein [Martelella lutilitoris]
MRIKKSAQASVFLSVLLSVSSVFAQQDTAETISGTCYALSFERGENDVRNLMLRLDPSDNEDSAPYLMTLSLSYWDVPNERFGTIAGCSGGDKIHCSIDCDGGNAYLTLADGGVLNLESERLRLEDNELIDSALANVMDADGGELRGNFVLTPVDDEACIAEPEAIFAELEIGDMLPRVTALEASLNRLGLFLAYPDPVFDEKTREAVVAFQMQYGFAPTGVVDQATDQALNTIVRSTIGGC